MKIKSEGRVNLLLGGALNDELEKLTRKLLQEDGLITSKTDLIRAAVAFYIKAIPRVVGDSRILTLADVQEVMLDLLDQKSAGTASARRD